MDQKIFLLSLSLSFSLSLIITAVHADVFDELLSSAIPPLRLTPLSATADNETIFQTSEKLCAGCTGKNPLLFVYEHNLVRAKKELAPLSWDARVAAYAASYAEERRHDCEVIHSRPPPEDDYGENIYWCSGKDWTPGDAVKAWADEESFYNYETNTCQEGEMCGHYTQLVWSMSEKVGCAAVHCDTGDSFVTCNYSPPGNYEGEKPY